MEKKEPIGNTILYKKELLFTNDTVISTQGYKKNSPKRKRARSRYIFGLVIFLVILAMFITAFFIDPSQETVRNTLLIVSSIGFALQLAMFSSFYLRDRTSKIGNLSPTHIHYEFFEDSILSYLCCNDEVISTYNISYNKVTKAIIQKDYTLIFNTISDPLAIDNSAFSDEKVLDFIEKKLRENNVTVMISSI